MTQREIDSTAVIKAGKAAPVGRLSFIFKQADHVAYWQIPFQTVSDAAGSGGGCAHSAGAMEVLLAVMV